MRTLPAVDDPSTERGSASAAAGIDRGPFTQVFFDEAGENLDHLERMLLQVDLVAADTETLNAIFRCAHSVKGGAAAFGFADVAALTHQIESLLDKLRRGELRPTAAMVDVLLQAGDALRAQLARHRGGASAPVDTTALLRQIHLLASGSVAPLPAQRSVELTLGPLDNPARADDVAGLFSEIPGLGTIEALDGGHAADGLRRFKITTGTIDSELIDLFGFHVPRAQVRLSAFGAGGGLDNAASGAPPAEVDAPAAAGAAAAAATRTDKAPAAGPGDAATLRVSVEKVDRLINLVGELVITQAMLAQNGKSVDAALYPQVAAGLADLERHTRDLQEAVMSIRMIPMATVFNRFPRMLRDLAAKLGKRVELAQVGEATELDKGLVEKITDPLTHLVRNSCDHGIELPAERSARGKPEHGTVTLTASHQGGSIVIEVRDDGRGLNRERLLAEARGRGLDAPDSMSDQAVFGLIFMPGFSTAEVVTDVSGRGVGMDVVNRNISALGGTVEIDSAEGQGMSVKVRLPLTLAIMDGMCVGVGAERYILPLGSVVESFQAGSGTLKPIGSSGRVVAVRDEYMPVIELERVFDVPRFDFERGPEMIVVVEAKGARVALLVDELLGQQQVVVKNLESNYRKVADVSGATIMGDGRVALIVDVGSLVRRTRH